MFALIVHQQLSGVPIVSKPYSAAIETRSNRHLVLEGAIFGSLYRKTFFGSIGDFLRSDKSPLVRARRTIVALEPQIVGVTEKALVAFEVLDCSLNCYLVGQIQQGPEVSYRPQSTKMVHQFNR